MRRKILPFILGGALAVATVAPAAATHTTQHATQQAGAAGLVAAVLQVAANIETGDIEVITVDVDRSLNNLLRNATFLNNVLNNLLRNADIDVAVTDIRVITVEGVEVLQITFEGL